MDLIDRFAASFEGSRVAHGQTTVGSVRKNGKTDAKSYIVREPLTKELIAGHLDGSHGVGAIPINDQNMCKFGALDIDTYPIDHKAIVKKCIIRYSNIYKNNVNYKIFCKNRYLD